jgi:hypothetical protein
MSVETSEIREIRARRLIPVMLLVSDNRVKETDFLYAACRGRRGCFGEGWRRLAATTGAPLHLAAADAFTLVHVD